MHQVVHVVMVALPGCLASLVTLIPPSIALEQTRRLRTAMDVVRRHKTSMLEDKNPMRTNNITRCSRNTPGATVRPSDKNGRHCPAPTRHDTHSGKAHSRRVQKRTAGKVNHVEVSRGSGNAPRYLRATCDTTENANCADCSS